MHRDQFLTDQEIAELVDARVPSARSPAGPSTVPGAWSTARSTSATPALPLHELKQARIIGVSGSPERVEAIRAALRGGLLGGLITDERTAVAVLRRAK